MLIDKIDKVLENKESKVVLPGKFSILQNVNGKEVTDTWDYRDENGVPVIDLLLTEEN